MPSPNKDQSVLVLQILRKKILNTNTGLLVTTTGTRHTYFIAMHYNYLKRLLHSYLRYNIEEILI